VTQTTAPALAGPSPVDQAERLSEALGLDLRVKRDDLLPMPGGGNKVRKMARIADEAAHAGADALVTTGGAQSNHARVTALEAARRGWACRLVLHGDPAALDQPEGNLLLMVLTGAEVEVVPADAVRQRLDAARDELSNADRTPHLVPGGGHSVAGALAYADAVAEAKAQLGPWVPDWIVVASGTGGTQAGLVAGCVAEGWPSRVLGVSVARPAERGAAAVREVLEGASEALGAEPGPVDFRDGWTAGGYERVDGPTLDAVRSAARAGLVLDPTYTGKAFASLRDLTRTGEIAPGSRVLFWHTGGLLNLLARPSTVTDR
jgi:1-aminocyclopropane-1-carboxylate deaminase/D-cysteine desulfhydrase-like pyridoxal-dependent ACC family enzyme